MKQKNHNLYSILTTITLCFAMIVSITFNPSHTKAASLTDNVNQKADISIKTYKRTFKDKNGDIVKTVSYKYPYMKGNSKVAKEFNQVVKKAKAAWIKRTKATVQEATELHQQLVANGQKDMGYYGDDVKCQVTYNNEKYISIYQEGYDYRMGAHGSPYSYSYIFDATTGKLIQPAIVLGYSQKQINQKIRALYLKKYDKTIHTDDFLFFEDREFVKSELNHINFNVSKEGSNGSYLKNNRIYFYIEPSIVGSYAAGYVKLSIKLPISK